jgi:hypothetical protein
MSVPVLPVIAPTPDEVYHRFFYQFDPLEIIPVVKIPVRGPAPYNTLAVVQSRADITRWSWSLGELSRRSIPVGNGLRVARFDPNDPRQRQVAHSSSAVIRLMQITDESDFVTDDDNTTFVLAVDRVRAQSTIDDYGHWSLTIDVADSAWAVNGFAYAEITSWVLFYEPPALPGSPPEPSQPMSALRTQAAPLLAAYRDYADLPNADILKAAAELAQLDRRLSNLAAYDAAADAEQLTIDMLSGFSPSAADRAAYLIALAEARHNLIARLVDVGRTEQVPGLASESVAGYLAYAHSPGADQWRAARDLSAMVKPLLAADDLADALAAQQACVDVLAAIEPAGQDRLEQLIELAEARHNLVARMLDASQIERAAEQVPAAIAAYRTYAATDGSDIDRAVRDLTELATVVLAPAGLADLAAAAQQAAAGLLP